MTRADLRGWDGLWRIWTEPGLFGRPPATQQYYPLVHSAFWVQHRLWGENPLGYHLVNVTLHIIAALLVAMILRFLEIPGAFWIAAIFALHPVHVESVAWITELKNTSAAVFYLGAMLCYLKFDRSRQTAWYAAALALFVLGLMCKTVIATLPAGLLVILWWQWGKLSWGRDIAPLIPWFVLAMLAGLLTVYVEHNVLHARGHEYQLNLVERLLIAGRAPWFYAGKLVWPLNLTFIYPRWKINQSDWRQYLFPVATLVLIAVCWLVRKRWRGPLAAVLFFGGTLFPALGFINVYPFRYSFVADHFQYLASLGIVTLAAATASWLLAKGPLWLQAMGVSAGLALLAALGWLTYAQAGMYVNAEQVYQTTLNRNPDCWMAYNNLGELRNSEQKYDEAKAFFLKALEINSTATEIRNNVGAVRERDGLPDAAQTEYELALNADPDYLPAHTNLGRLHVRRGRFEPAITHLRKVLERQPDADVCGNLAIALYETGSKDEALELFRRAIVLAPNDASTYNNLAVVLLRAGILSDAIANFRKALELRSDYPEALQGLDEALSRQKSHAP